MDRQRRCVRLVGRPAREHFECVALVCSDQLHAGSHGQADQLRRHGEEHDDRRPDAGAAQEEGLVQAGHAEPVGTRRREDARGRLDAVAVRVGFDHRVDLHPRPDQLAHRAQVVGQRLLVDLEPARPGQRWQPGRGQARFDRFGAHPAASSEWRARAIS